jgi:hypothetical protein
MRRESFLIKPLVSFIVLTVVLLAPSPGFITLTIPDVDSDGQNITIPDFPHVGKRALGELPLQVQAVMQSNSRFAFGTESESDVISRQEKYLPAFTKYYFAIRAPPCA